MRWLSTLGTLIGAIGRSAYQWFTRRLCSLVHQDRLQLADPCNDPIACAVGYCYDGLGGYPHATRIGGLMTEKACVVASGPGKHSWHRVRWPLVQSTTAPGWEEIDATHQWDTQASPPNTTLMC